MDSLNNLKEKIMNAKITKSWQYLAYIYLLLPAVLFLLGWLARDNSLGKAMGGLFHNYGLFAVSPIPNFSSFTGIIGLGIAVWFLVTAIRRKDWLDLAISAILVALNAAYFLLGANYYLLSMLSLQ